MCTPLEQFDKPAVGFDPVDLFDRLAALPVGGIGAGGRQVLADIAALDGLHQRVRLDLALGELLGHVALAVVAGQPAALLREAGHDQPIYLHGAQETLCALYENFGVRLGPLKSATAASKAELAGAIVLAPPGAIADRWARRLPDPVTAVASGWMRIRQRAKQRGVELPLVISDHADWDELLRTVEDVDAPEVWVTHGREEALIHAVTQRGRKARALALIGFDEEGQ